MTSTNQNAFQTIFPNFPSGPVVSVDYLAQHREDKDLIILCASMGNPERSRAQAIPGAYLADIDGDFSEPNSDLPHTVPRNLQTLLESYGISDDSTVIVYDRHGLMVAPRIWWLLKAAGLEKIGILDGGLPAWIAQGLATEPITNIPQGGGTITASPRSELLVDITSVKQALDQPFSAVVDVRSAGRFAGVEAEPRPGLVSGHMPGSVNIPFTSLSNQQGKLKSVEELQSTFSADTDDADDLVFSCGSGVTACVGAYAAVAAGYDTIKVYDGSWSQWGDPELGKPIIGAN